MWPGWGTNPATRTCSLTAQKAFGQEQMLFECSYYGEPTFETFPNIF